MDSSLPEQPGTLEVCSALVVLEITPTLSPLTDCFHGLDPGRGGGECRQEANPEPHKSIRDEFTGRFLH